MSLNKAYNLAAVAVRRRLAEQHPDRLAVLDEIGKRDVAVYSGNFDTVQEVLKRINIGFVLDPKKPSATIVFSNCANGKDDNRAKLLERHVRDGGWLVSSDWQLNNLIQPAFPNTVRWTGQRGTSNEVVGVEANLSSVWSEVVFPGIDPQWWLESGSHPITIEDPERVRIEAVSHELHVRYQASPVAVSFDCEAGHVFHVISHFWLKQTRIPDDRYRRPCTDFLRNGMRLSEPGIEAVLAQTKTKPEDVNLAEVQSAVTSVELVAGLCVRAMQGIRNATANLTGTVPVASA
jgi:hypothetical protein